MDNKSDLRPNDVAVILRPTFENDEWVGGFEVLVSGFGPITIAKENMDDMIGMGVLLASVIPFMEEHEEIAKQVMEYCSEFYGDVGEFEYDPNHDSFGDSLVLTEATKTVGGKH